jgi:hypothetical protein
MESPSDHIEATAADDKIIRTRGIMRKQFYALAALGFLEQGCWTTRAGDNSAIVKIPNAVSTRTVIRNRLKDSLPPELDIAWTASLPKCSETLQDAIAEQENGKPKWTEVTEQTPYFHPNRANPEKRLLEVRSRNSYGNGHGQQCMYSHDKNKDKKNVVCDVNGKPCGGSPMAAGTPDEVRAAPTKAMAIVEWMTYTGHVTADVETYEQTRIIDYSAGVGFYDVGPCTCAYLMLHPPGASMENQSPKPADKCVELANGWHSAAGGKDSMQSLYSNLREQCLNTNPPNDPPIFSAGPTYTIAEHDAIGGEVTAVTYPGPRRLGVGAFVQAEKSISNGGWRTAGGGQVNFHVPAMPILPIDVGLEAGMAYVSHSSNDKSRVDLQLAPFISAGVVYVSSRYSIPVNGDGNTDNSVVLGVKLPLNAKFEPFGR